MVSKILLVEDAEESKDLVCSALGPSFDVSWAITLKDAVEFTRREEFHLILLDVGLSDGDGFHFFSMLKNERRQKNTPVIFLTARHSLSDRVMGISMGAEDYILKPFLAGELRARVEMRIKKNSEKMEEAKIIKREGLEVNLTEQRGFLVVANRKTDLDLTPIEFKILVLLITHEEQIFSRDQILSMVWGENTFLTDRCVDTHVYSLRKKLGNLSSWVQSIYGQGYRLCVKKEELKLQGKRAG